MITGRRRRFVTGRFESDSFFVDEASEDKIHAESDSGREARLIKEVALHRGLSLPAAGARSGFADFLISLFFFSVHWHRNIAAVQQKSSIFKFCEL